MGGQIECLKCARECVYVRLCVCVRVCICRMKPRDKTEIVEMLTAVNEAWNGIQQKRGLTADFETMFKDPDKFASMIAPAAPAASPPRGSKGKGRGAGGAVNDSRVGGTAAVPAAAPSPPPVSPTGGGGVSSGRGGGGWGRGGGADGAGAGSRVESSAAVPPTAGAAPAGNAGRGTSAFKKRQSEEDTNAGGSVCTFSFSNYSLLSHRLYKHAGH